MLNCTCLPIQGNARSQMCQVSRQPHPVDETPTGFFVGGEPLLLRASGGDLTEVQRNLE